MPVTVDKQITHTRATPHGVERQTIHATDEAPSGTVIAARLVYWILGVVLTLLAFRFVLALLGANLGNAFAKFVFDVSQPLVQPFFGLFNYTPSYGISRVEVGTLVAMAVYAVIAVGIVALLRLPRRGDEV